jgi:hypothetical protein
VTVVNDELDRLAGEAELGRRRLHLAEQCHQRRRPVGPQRLEQTLAFGAGE